MFGYPDAPASAPSESARSFRLALETLRRCREVGSTDAKTVSFGSIHERNAAMAAAIGNVDDALNIEKHFASPKT